MSDDGRRGPFSFLFISRLFQSASTPLRGLMTLSVQGRTEEESLSGEIVQIGYGN